MNILYICPKSTYFTKGMSGSVAHAKGVVEGLLKNGCKVELVSGPGSREFLDPNPNLTLTEIPVPFWGEWAWRRQLIALVEEKLRGVNDPAKNHLLIRYTISCQFLLRRVARLCRRYNCTSVIEVNSLLVHYDFLPRLLNPLIFRFEVSGIRRFDRIYLVSKGMEEEILSRVPEAKTLVIPNATGRTQPAHSREVGKVRFLYLGVFHRYYDFDSLFEAFRKLPDPVRRRTELAFYGKGLLEKKIRKKSDGLKGTRFYGEYISGKLESIVNRKRDVLLLPYNGHRLCEIGSPVKLFEYMALGAPVVAYEGKQILEVLEDRVTGFLYRTPGELTALMQELAEDPELRIRVGKQAHRAAVEHHTWEKRMKVLTDNL